MDKEGLRQRLMGIFLNELDGHVQALTTDLNGVTPGSPLGVEQLERLRRAAHTLKGAARSAGVPLIEAAARHMEVCFVAVRDGRQALDAALVKLLLEATHAVGDAGARLRAGQDLSAAPIAALASRLPGTG
jgi:two-component system chemotaxis sensor kinase CheA